MQIFIIKSDVYLLSTTPAKNYAIGDSLVESLHIFFSLEYNTNVCGSFYK
jgi:hypothetical protein